MLLKSQRLNLKKDFKWVAAGFKKETPSFKLMWKDSTNEMPRVGIAMSSQVFKKAHDRNRARRLSSTAIQLAYSSLRKSINLVIMPKTGVLKKHPEELSKEIADVKDIFTTY